MLLLLLAGVLRGSADGFTAVWTCLLPSFYIFFYGLKQGTVLSCILECFFLFLFWTDIGSGFRGDVYGSSFRERYPILLAVSFLLSFLLESIRGSTYQKLKEVSERNYYLSQHDPLTGVRNRTGFLLYLKEKEQVFQQEGLALLMLDVDHFKRVNDRYGHFVGDKLLQKLAVLLETELEGRGEICRWGGEEFLILLAYSIKNRNFAEVLRKKVEETELIIDGVHIPVTVSVGVVICPQERKIPINSLIQQADECMYEAKKNGRNQVYRAQASEIVGSFENENEDGELHLRKDLGKQLLLQNLDRRIQEGKELESQPLHVIFFNVRRFKSYNMRMGERSGDQLLQDVLLVMGKQFEEGHTSRFADDHFVVFTDSSRVMEQIQQMQEWFMWKYGAYNLRLKAGIVQVTDRKLRAATVCDYAKIACDSIRKSGEDVCYYDESLSRLTLISDHVVQTIDSAIAHGCIQVYYQPVVETETGKLCGMEALARWNDPEYGFLSPSKFITALEENRQIHKLDFYVIREVCRQLREQLQAGGVTPVPVSFNLSRIDFSECDVFAKVEDILERYQIPRNLVNVEITESMMIDNPQFVEKSLSLFRKAGYQVWMDDFGSGYSSLNVLKEYQFDEIKLDMMFLTTLDERSRTIVAAVVAMAKAVGIQTLAEGVETEEQFRFLREIHCDKVQGYLFGKPLPIEEFYRHCGEKGLLTDSRKTAGVQ